MVKGMIAQGRDASEVMRHFVGSKQRFFGKHTRAEIIEAGLEETVDLVFQDLTHRIRSYESGAPLDSYAPVYSQGYIASRSRSPARAMTPPSSPFRQSFTPPLSPTCPVQCCEHECPSGEANAEESEEQQQQGETIGKKKRDYPEFPRPLPLITDTSRRKLMEEMAFGTYQSDEESSDRDEDQSGALGGQQLDDEESNDWAEDIFGAGALGLERRDDEDQLGAIGGQQLDDEDQSSTSSSFSHRNWQHYETPYDPRLMTWGQMQGFYHEDPDEAERLGYIRRMPQGGFMELLPPESEFWHESEAEDEEDEDAQIPNLVGTLEPMVSPFGDRSEQSIINLFRGKKLSQFRRLMRVLRIERPDIHDMLNRLYDEGKLNEWMDETSDSEIPDVPAITELPPSGAGPSSGPGLSYFSSGTNLDYRDVLAGRGIVPMDQGETEVPPPTAPAEISDAESLTSAGISGAGSLPSAGISDAGSLTSAGTSDAGSLTSAETSHSESVTSSETSDEGRPNFADEPEEDQFQRWAEMIAQTENPAFLGSIWGTLQDGSTEPPEEQAYRMYTERMNDFWRRAQWTARDYYRRCRLPKVPLRSGYRTRQIRDQQNIGTNVENLRIERTRNVDQGVLPHMSETRINELMERRGRPPLAFPYDDGRSSELIDSQVEHYVRVWVRREKLLNRYVREGMTKEERHEARVRALKKYHASICSCYDCRLYNVNNAPQGPMPDRFPEDLPQLEPYSDAEFSDTEPEAVNWSLEMAANLPYNDIDFADWEPEEPVWSPQLAAELPFHVEPEGPEAPEGMEYLGPPPPYGEYANFEQPGFEEDEPPPPYEPPTYDPPPYEPPPYDPPPYEPPQ